MKIIHTLLFIVLFLTACQNTSEPIEKEDLFWTFSDDNFSYIAKLDSVQYHSGNPKKYEAVTAIEIKQSDNIIQTIISPDTFIHESFFEADDVLVIEDVNFDGHNDIALLNWTSTNIQVSYWYWLYNDKEKIFKRDTSLEDIWNPKFDAENKVIYNYYTVGACCSNQEIHAWENSRIVKRIKQSEDFPFGHDTTGYLSTIIYLENDTIEKFIELNDGNNEVLSKEELYGLINKQK